jgi:hypothetical protein
MALGVFSRTEQRVLRAVFKAIEDGDGCCVATLATLARASNTSRTTTRTAIARAVAIGLLEETENGYRLGSQAGGTARAPAREPRGAGLPGLVRL